MQTKKNSLRASFCWLVAFLALVGTPSSAQDALCDDLWFTRNLVFDRAGYCFGSTLGQSVFGNDGCTTKSPQISAADKALISLVKDYEAEWSCAVDTSRTQLVIPMLSLRKALGDLPVMTGYESACIGWQGPEMPLYLAKDTAAQRIGSLKPGQSILTAYENPDGWEFATITDANGETLAMGWLQLEAANWTCAEYAG